MVGAGRPGTRARIELSPTYFEVYPEDLLGILVHESVHVGLALQGDNLVVKRPVYSGKALATVDTAGKRPQVISLRPNVFAAEESGGSAAVENLDGLGLSIHAVVKELVKAAGGELDVAEADIIVSGGRGIQKPENFKLLHELAEPHGLLLDEGVQRHLAGLDHVERLLPHRRGAGVGVDLVGGVGSSCDQVKHVLDRLDPGRVGGIARLVTPLSLTDPTSPAFKPEFCQSLHDVTRYVHEKTFEVVFHWNDVNWGDTRHARQLRVHLPLTMVFTGLATIHVVATLLLWRWWFFMALQ